MKKIMTIACVQAVLVLLLLPIASCSTDVGIKHSSQPVKVAPKPTHEQLDPHSRIWWWQDWVDDYNNALPKK